MQSRRVTKCLLLRAHWVTPRFSQAFVLREICLQSIWAHIWYRVRVQQLAVPSAQCGRLRNVLCWAVWRVKYTVAHYSNGFHKLEGLFVHQALLKNIKPINERQCRDRVP
jgi:hypothetical protein